LPKKPSLPGRERSTGEKPEPALQAGGKPATRASAIFLLHSGE
jgi:hypothetical protein